MTDLLLDTHALIWYLEKSPNLSAAARAAITASVAAGHALYVSAVSLAEILYLEEKGRLVAGTLSRVAADLSRPGASLVEVPFTGAVVQAMTKVPRTTVPDLPDRMIAGTAVNLGVPLVTADRQIRSAGLPTVW